MNERHQVDLYVHFQGLEFLALWCRTFGDQLDRIEKLQLQGEKTMSVLTDKISALNAEVTRQKTIKDSVLALIAGIPALIADAVAKATAAGATPAELAAFDELSATITKNDDDLAAAIVANVPPPPPPNVP